MNEDLILSNMTIIKYHLFQIEKEIPDDIINLIIFELTYYYKERILRRELNKIINSLNFLGRCYYIDSKKIFIYKHFKYDIIKFNRINLFY
jgi:hypothetical protein